MRWHYFVLYFFQKKWHRKNVFFLQCCPILVIPSISYGNRGTPWTSRQFITGLAHKTPSKRVKKGRLEGQSLSSTPTFTHSHNTSRERKSCSYYTTLWLNLILLLMLLLRILFLRRREKPNTTWFSSLVEKVKSQLPIVTTFHFVTCMTENLHRHFSFCFCAIWGHCVQICSLESYTVHYEDDLANNLSFLWKKKWWEGFQSWCFQVVKVVVTEALTT